jgi:hypothetical protein
VSLEDDGARLVDLELGAFNEVREIGFEERDDRGSLRRASGRRDSDDRFDLDLMVELYEPNATARHLLDTLYQTIKGERGSRYHDITHRMTRCVQIRYADMHLDLTPALYVGPWYSGRPLEDGAVGAYFAAFRKAFAIGGMVCMDARSFELDDEPVHGPLRHIA